MILKGRHHDFGRGLYNELGPPLSSAFLMDGSHEVISESEYIKYPKSWIHPRINISLYIIDHMEV